MEGTPLVPLADDLDHVARGGGGEEHTGPKLPESKPFGLDALEYGVELGRVDGRVLPHSAFRGQTPDEMYFGMGDAVPADLTSRATVARRSRLEDNRSAFCETCPSNEAAA